MASSPRIGLAVAAAASLVAVDQIVKWIAMRAIGAEPNNRDFWLIDNQLGLSLVHNRGVAFGLLEGQPSFVLLTAAAIALALVGSFVWLHRESPIALAAGVLIVGGSIGNAIDRARFGYVQDFFVVGPWPVFNVADASITIGAIAAAFAVLRLERQDAGNPATEQRRLTPLDSPE